MRQRESPSQKNPLSCSTGCRKSSLGIRHDYWEWATVTGAVIGIGILVTIGTNKNCLLSGGIENSFVIEVPTDMSIIFDYVENCFFSGVQLRLRCTGRCGNYPNKRSFKSNNHLPNLFARILAKFLCVAFGLLYDDSGQF